MRRDDLPFGRNVIVILQSPDSSGTNTALPFSIVASPGALPPFAAENGRENYQQVVLQFNDSMCKLRAARRPLLLCCRKIWLAKAGATSHLLSPDL
jgi:hypothetical protein